MAIIVGQQLSVSAQVCMSGWDYRKTVGVDNSANVFGLSDFQISFDLNTSSLIAAGKMNADGSDVRILSSSGNALPFWIEQGTVNTTNTTIWVKLDTIAAATSDSIFLFYGSAIASSLQNGESTFSFFDDFESGSLDASKWTFCNGGTLSFTSGQATLSSTGTTTDRAVMKTISTFGYPVISEAHVVSTAIGMTVLGQTNSSNDGYGMAFENIGGGVTTMRVMETNNSVNCQDLVDLSVINAENASTTSGIWKFSWTMQNQQYFTWPGASGDLVRTGFNNTFENDISGTLSLQDKAGSVTAEWYRMRKYTPNEPVTMVGDEISIGNPIIAVSSNSPICVTDSIRLVTNQNSNIMYLWSGPNGFSSVNADTTFPASLIKAGTYTLHTSDSAGCEIRPYNVVVQVNAEPSKGIISNDSVVCEGSDIQLVLTGYTGNVDHWEQASAGSGPWVTLSAINDTMSLLNLKTSGYYRVVLTNGGCSVNSDSVFVQVDDSANGGFLLGPENLCYGTDGLITAQGFSSGVAYWLSSTNNGVNWDTTFTTQSSLPISDFDDSLGLAVCIVADNGACPVVASDTFFIALRPNPNSDFIWSGVCENTLTSLTNNTAIYSGSIVKSNWDFGDGQTSVASDPNHLFDAGSFTVELVSESDYGCLDTIQKNVVISAIPVPDYTMSTSCEQEDITFTNVTSIASGSISGYSWDFGDGSLSTSPSPTNRYAAMGNYTIRLIATAVSGCVDSLVQNVSIETKPVVDFDSDTVCEGASIQFVNSTPNLAGGINYEWRYGDGNNSVLESPTYMYSSVGSYNVMLIATSSYSCKDTLFQTAVVNPNPVADFLAQNHCLTDTLVLVNNSNSGTTSGATFTWNFGDGNVSVDSLPTNLYLIPNNYQITLDVSNEFGCKEDTFAYINVAERPVVNFSFQNACEGNIVSFTNLTTPTGNIQYQWNFGDGNTDTVSAPMHGFLQDTSYFVQLMATSGSACVDSLTKSILIYPNPEASFSVPDVCLGFSSPFTNNSQINSGTIVSNNWDFGDGNASAILNPTYSYLNAGNYAVKLTVTSDLGCMDDTTITTNVSTGPTANFNVADVCDKEEMTFANLSTVSVTTTYSWDFGDSSNSIIPSPVHTYEGAGVYSVKLVAADLIGCADSITKAVIVYNLPILNTIEDTAISKGRNIEIWAQGGLSYIWTPVATFDNPFLSNPLATPTETTTYNVQVTDTKGCVNYDSVHVEVVEDFYLNVFNIITPDANGQNDVWVIENIDSYPDHTISVFDQSGKKVYESIAYQNDWDGNFNGEPLPDGGYYFVINLTIDLAVREYKGVLTILRNQE